MNESGSVAAGADQQYVTPVLPAGRYAAVCLIPVGRETAEMEDMVFDPNADTHMRRGMFAEFTVG